jgi:hypothetical protein
VNRSKKRSQRCSRSTLRRFSSRPTPTPAAMQSVSGWRNSRAATSAPFRICPGPRLDVHPLELIECLSRAERAVGAPGGAMDQAVCIAGRPRTALKVDFDPLTLTPIDVPDRWKFVIAYSGVTADKSGSAEQACHALSRDFYSSSELEQGDGRLLFLA